MSTFDSEYARVQHALGGRTIQAFVPEPGISGDMIQLLVTFDHSLVVTNVQAALITKETRSDPDVLAAAAVLQAEDFLREAAGG